jgi:GNAT superfamily N-acetyltransferase
MPDLDYLVRFYKPGDEEQLVTLFNLVFNDWPRFDINCEKTEHWNWKFLDTPVNIKQIVVAETYAGRIIGASQAIFKRTKIGNNIYIVRKGAGIAVHPEYRRMGVYSNIIKFRDDRCLDTGAVVSYALTDNPIIVQRKEGKKGVDPEEKFPPLKQFIKIINMDKFLKYLEEQDKINGFKSFQIQIGYRILSVINNIRNIIIPKYKSIKNLEIIKVKKFDHKINQLWDDVKDDYYLITEKSEDYLNWRYCDSRGGNNRVWVAKESEGIEGYVAVKVNKLDPEFPIGYIMEISSKRGREHILGTLIEKAINYLTDEEAIAIYYTINSGHTYTSTIKRHGFIDSRRQKRVFYKVYKDFEDLELLKNADSRYVNYQFGEFDSI